jgi:Tfp pilus assembly protein FimV
MIIAIARIDLTGWSRLVRYRGRETMVRRLISEYAALGSIALLASIAAVGPARGQMSSNPAEITGCLCQQQAIATLSADMSAKKQALSAARQRVGDLDAQLSQARQHIDVNNPQSEEQYKQLLAQRDQAYQASIGPVVGEADQATARYNAHVSQYNAQCANRVFNADVMAELRSHLVCPPLE